MNAYQDISAAVRAVDQPSGLSAIRDQDCPAVIWQRPGPEAFADWLSTLAPRQLPRMREVLRPEAVRAGVAEACDLAGMPEGAGRNGLVDDIADLADVFAALMDAPYLRVRLEVVETNACRKFHIDGVTARLVCTYRGTGTQYGFTTGPADPDPIHTVPTGVPILLRGTLWPIELPAKFLHRSPPIEGTGETRLVLVLDPMTQPEEEI